MEEIGGGSIGNQEPYVQSRMQISWDIDQLTELRGVDIIGDSDILENMPDFL